MPEGPILFDVSQKDKRPSMKSWRRSLNPRGGTRRFRRYGPLLHGASPRLKGRSDKLSFARHFGEIKMNRRTACTLMGAAVGSLFLVGPVTAANPTPTSISIKDMHCTVCAKKIS